MYSYRMIFNLLLVMGMLSGGCASRNQNSKEPSGELNQVNQTGERHGPWEFYKDSALISKGSYVDGVPDGLWTSWYTNGQMKEEGHYKEGVKSGMWIEWYQDGEIMWKGEWKNGKREIDQLEYQAKVSFIGIGPNDNILVHDSLYRLNIRIQNIPASNLFVEVSSGEIYRGEEPDLFILKTPSDTILTMAIGYMPDLEFTDFRNLISEIDFKIK